jgi:hypothetical protein
MRCGFAQGLLIVSALFGVVAVCAFLMYFAPFTEKGPSLWLFLSVASVVLPYAVLFAVCRSAIDSISRTTATVASIIIAAFGGYAYFFSFGPNDGEYAFAYFLVPMVQAPIVLVALSVTWWRRRAIHSIAA